MTLTLDLRQRLTCPVEASGLIGNWSPELLADDIRRMPVPCGNTEIALGDLFHVSGNYSDRRSIWTGEGLDNLHGLGTGQSDGETRIESSIGNRCGVEMGGGTLLVRGNAGDDLGGSMSGGTLLLSGNAGARLGGCRSGASTGMCGGQILVEGHGGTEAGIRMRRGTIVIAGNCDSGGGFQMVAGTFLVGGLAGPCLGHEMKRGTIIALSPLRDEVPPFRFRESGRSQGGFMAVLARFLEQTLTKLPVQSPALHSAIGQLFSPFQRHTGDHLQCGRGELLTPFASPATLI